MTEAVALGSMPAGETPRRLRVGSWPGPTFKDNAFISIYCRALEVAGATIVDVADPRRLVEPVDILQIHWPEELFWRVREPVRLVKAVFETLWALARLRRRGARVVWLVHNLRPHDADTFHRLVWRIYAKRLASMVDGYASLSPATAPIIALAFGFGGRVPGCGLRHPRYPPPTDLPVDRAHLRSALDTPRCERLLVFVGSMRRYKGLGPLVAAAAACDPARIGLVVAGRAEDAALRCELQAQVAGLDHLDLRPERLSEEDFAGLVGASDYVVLPFVDSLHSGSVVHALSLSRAVVTPATPFAEDLAATVGAQWVRTYDGALSPQFLSALPPPPDGAPDLSLLDEGLFGRTLAAFYQELLKSEPRGGV